MSTRIVAHTVGAGSMPDWTKPTSELLSELGLTYSVGVNGRNRIFRGAELLAEVDAKGANLLIADLHGVEPPEWCLGVRCRND